MPVDPNTKDRLFNATGRSADTPVLAQNVTPSESPVAFEITTAINVSSAVDLVEYQNATDTAFNHTINDGSAVSADTLHTEPVPVSEDSEYNVQYRQDVDVHVLQIDERSLIDEN